MPKRASRVKETRTPYRARRKPASKVPAVTLKWTEVENATEPIVLERDGQPVAVALKYDVYWQLDAARLERRQRAWQELEAVLARVHSRTQRYSAEEIEADVTAAQQEVKAQRLSAYHQKGD
jgi:hypothetical protein